MKLRFTLSLKNRAQGVLLITIIDLAGGNIDDVVVIGKDGEEIDARRALALWKKSQRS